MDSHVPIRKLSILQFAFLVLIGVFALLGGCTRKTTVVLAEDPSTGWAVQIIEVSEPGEVMIASQRSFMDPGFQSMPFASVPQQPTKDGHKWLVVELSIAPSGTYASPGASAQHDIGSVMGIERVQLVAGDGNSYPPEALSAGESMREDESGQGLPSFHRDPPYRVFDASGEPLITYKSNFVVVHGAEPQQLFLLFSVPKRSPELRLQLPEAYAYTPPPEREPGGGVRGGILGGPLPR